VRCLEEEFYRQGDREKAAQLPVSPLFDRAKPGVTKSQVGFFDVVVLPLFQVGAPVSRATTNAWALLLQQLWLRLRQGDGGSGFLPLPCYSSAALPQALMCTPSA